MMNFHDVNYKSLLEKEANELFFLRKKTFKDRLDWMVDCEENMEFDIYDNENTTYILGVCNGLVFCGLRFIETARKNMITHTFQSYFDNVTLPKGAYIEASRLFVDKSRVCSLYLSKYPISLILFLSMINYANSISYQGIYAVVSHPMLIIFQRSGWEISIVQKGTSEKNKNIYLIHMPVDKHNQIILMERISEKMKILSDGLTAWPLSFELWGNGSDKSQLDPESYSVLSVGDA